MAKRSHAKRKRHQNHAAEERFHQDDRGRHRAPPNGNIVEINASRQLQTAYAPPRANKPLTAYTTAQQDYIDAIQRYHLTFGIGPAGTGKSYCAGAIAAEALESGRIERIILTRPAVEAGEQLGFLPGALDEKFSVYIDAFREILAERLGAGTVDYCLRHGRIVAAPLAFMRGKTFNNRTFVILDEAQNTSPAQMKMFLTRIGEGCKVVINGDIEQSDIRGHNGLADAVNRLGDLPNVYIHQFERADIVRSGLVRDIMDRYELV
ncbi:PhoH family protein [Marinimicrobium sp. C6131]|uniref:PhoH family protein n=1 Tax=Marinimicrobium sp. C6131 TaxID=3022676 RepID=UPI00223D0266|nr:PhoH family protein [Marinimicrobium sp. C6131]UZJ44770.1 PhoH family protein [Marinimicrobium sp. C6131]